MLKNIQSTLKLGQARGVAIIAAINSGVKIAEYSPREVKKSVTGSGASTKFDVKYMVKSILKMKDDSLTIDIYDSLAIALCHYYRTKDNFTGSFTRGKKSSSWAKYVEENPNKIIHHKKAIKK